MHNFEEDASNSASNMEIFAECPLHWLVSSDDFYSYVLARLEDPNERDSMGYTLLHVAAQSPVDNSRTLRLLLDRGADVDSTTPKGHTPLHFAVSSRNRRTLVALIKAGASVNATDLLGRTVLHFAISKEQSYSLTPFFEIACDMWIVKKLLCRRKMIVNPVDKAGKTPLVLAIEEQNSDAVGELLKNGANPNIPCKDNRTALHEAFSAEDPDFEIVFSLLLNGAGIYCKDNSGQTPIDILIRNVRDQVTLWFAELCVTSIALRYHIEDSLELKLEQIPHLSKFFKERCEEVTMMKKVVICDKFNLHDFVLDCIQVQSVADPVRMIYRPVVATLLSGVIGKYFEPILRRLTVQDLRGVLELIAPSSLQLNLIPDHRQTIYNAIKRSMTSGEFE